MIPAAWSDPLWSYLWQVALHASVLGLILYVWVHRLGLPSGGTRRRLLALLLVLPMMTAAVPGRTGVHFAEQWAWLNSARLLAVPLVGDLRVHHLVLAAGLLMTLVTIWQELSLALRRPKASTDDVPAALLRMVRERPGWEHCVVAISPAGSILVATSGVPGRPRLIASRGALETLTDTDLAIVVAHEHAHWQRDRWWRLHGLFVVRLLQCYHPAALWAFREYCLEVEVECDAAAVAGRDPHALARVLMRVYHGTDAHDVAARAALRKRVDVLIGPGPVDAGVPPATLATVAVVMLLVLPWLV